MTKVLYLVLTGLTYYIAGVYQCEPLMLLGVAEVLMGIIMFLIPRYLKHRFFVSFVYHDITVEKQERQQLFLQLINKSMLPISRYRVKLSISSPLEEERKLTLEGEIGGKQRKKSDFYAVFPRCGLYQIQKIGPWVSDFFTIFRSKSRSQDQMQVAVLPRKRSMQLQLPKGAMKNISVDCEVTSERGAAFDEILQLREYRPGDSMRRIHWNQSARLGEFWVKEYEKDTQMQSWLMINRRQASSASPVVLEAFYEIFSALVWGLLEHVDAVMVCWMAEGSGQLVQCKIEEGEKLAALLVEFYCMDQQIVPKKTEGEPIRELPKRHALQFDYALALYYDENQVFQFDEVNYEKQITSQYLTL